MIDRIIEMLERGETVELECIDLSKFLTEELNCKTRYNKKCMAEFNSLVDEASDVGVTMEDGFFIDEEELKHFRIKRSAPTFDDLIDVAIKAQKDGLIHKVEIISRRSIYVSEKPTSKSAYFNLTSIEAGISFINSLYTETFEIESEGDIERVKVGALIELSNGNSDRAMLTDKYSGQSMVQFSENKHWGAVGLFILKGATVTQKRGN